MIVYDSSGVIAYLNDEPGGDLVREYLNDADVPQYIHVVNMLEVFYRIARDGDVITAREAVAELLALGIEVRHDFDDAFWQDAATLKADHIIALGDCCGLALARRLDADFVTADKGDLKAAIKANVCRVTLIR